MQCNAVLCNIIWYNAISSNTRKCNAIPYNTIQSNKSWIVTNLYTSAFPLKLRGPNRCQSALSSQHRKISPEAPFRGIKKETLLVSWDFYCEWGERRRPRHPRSDRLGEEKNVLPSITTKYLIFRPLQSWSGLCVELYITRHHRKISGFPFEVCCHLKNISPSVWVSGTRLQKTLDVSSYCQLQSRIILGKGHHFQLISSSKADMMQHTSALA